MQMTYMPLERPQASTLLPSSVSHLFVLESFKYDILYSSRKLSKSNLGQRSFGEMPFSHGAMSEKGSGKLLLAT